MPLSSVVGASSILKPGVCTSSTRPAAPFEGQTIYETDTDRLATWDGSAWIPYVRQTAGKVLQVLQTVKTDTFTVSSTSYADITGLSVSITPTSSSSKILVSANTASTISTNGVFTLQLVRDSTAIYLGDAAGSRIRASFGSQSNSVDFNFQGTMLFLDSPATTSATTYKVQIRSNTGTVYVNRAGTDTDNTTYFRSASSITVMEISG